MNIEDQIKKAITSRTKLTFRLRTSPADKYILFRPYCLVEEVLFSKIKMYGLLEKHHSNDELANTLTTHEIDQIEEVILTPDKFEIPSDWEAKLDSSKFDILK